MPTWLVIAIAVGTPVLTFVAAVLGNLVARRTAHELETRSKREEAMRHLKWAAELAVSDDPRRADLGIRELMALAGSSLLDPEQQAFIEAAMETVYDGAEDEVAHAADEGKTVQVVLSDAPGPDPAPPPAPAQPVPPGADDVQLKHEEGELHG